MLDLSKPLLAQPELLQQLSDPEFIKVICCVSAFLSFFAALVSYAASPIRLPRPTNPVLLLGLALLVTSAVSPIPVGASLLLVGAWACWGVGIIGGTTAAICIIQAVVVVREVGSHVPPACKSLMDALDDFRAGAVTINDLGKAVGWAIACVAAVVLPIGVIAAFTTVIAGFVEPELGLMRLWLFLGGMAGCLAAPALIVRCVRRVLFHKRADADRRWSLAD